MEQISEKTNRCFIRFLTEADYPAYLEGYRNCEASKNRFDEGLIDISVFSREWYDELLKEFRKEAEMDHCYMFNVFEKSTGKSIGYCNIRTIYRGEIQCGEIGFDILHFHRLEAYINIDNPASKAIVKKCGYIFEDIREKYLLEDNVWTDNEVYYKINDCWKHGCLRHKSSS